MTKQQEELVKIARSLMGRPYQRGADSSGNPAYFDCSSLVQYIFRQLGIDLPRSSILQAASGKEINLSDGLEVGDLIFMRSDRGYYDDESFGGRKIHIGHVVLYIGDGKIIHSQKSAGMVIEQNLDELIKEPNYEIALIKRPGF
ncbi:MAG: C40 family peptidase [Patescibacteria group bacterium]